MCMFCWLSGHSSVKCRVRAPGCFNHGPDTKLVRGSVVGGPDYDSLLVGARVKVDTKHPKQRNFEGVVTAFDSDTGLHTITTDAGEPLYHYLGYVTREGMAIVGARLCVCSHAVGALLSDCTLRSSGSCAAAAGAAGRAAAAAAGARGCALHMLCVV